MRMIVDVVANVNTDSAEVRCVLTDAPKGESGFPALEMTHLAIAGILHDLERKFPGQLKVFIDSVEIIVAALNASNTETREV